MVALSGEHSAAIVIVGTALVIGITMLVALAFLGRAADDQSVSPQVRVVDKWWADHFEGKPASHPIPYLSGAWHAAFDAKEELKRRLTAL